MSTTLQQLVATPFQSLKCEQKQAFSDSIQRQSGFCVGHKVNIIRYLHICLQHLTHMHTHAIYRQTAFGCAGTHFRTIPPSVNGAPASARRTFGVMNITCGGEGSERCREDAAWWIAIVLLLQHLMQACDTKPHTLLLFFCITLCAINVLNCVRFLPFVSITSGVWTTLCVCVMSVSRTSRVPDCASLGLRFHLQITWQFSYTVRGRHCPADGDMAHPIRSWFPRCPSILITCARLRAVGASQYAQGVRSCCNEFVCSSEVCIPSGCSRAFQQENEDIHFIYIHIGRERERILPTWCYSGVSAKTFSYNKQNLFNNYSTLVPSKSH